MCKSLTSAGHIPPQVQVTARSSLFNKRANRMVECSYAGFHDVLVKRTNWYVFFLLLSPLSMTLPWMLCLPVATWLILGEIYMSVLNMRFKMTKWERLTDALCSVNSITNTAMGMFFSSSQLSWTKSFEAHAASDHVLEPRDQTFSLARLPLPQRLGRPARRFFFPILAAASFPEMRDMFQRNHWDTWVGRACERSARSDTFCRKCRECRDEKWVFVRILWASSTHILSWD